MACTLNIDQIDLISEEMAEVGGVNLNWSIIIAEIHFNLWVLSELAHDVISILFSLICELIDILLGGHARVVSCRCTVFNLKNWIESIEEGFEMNIFGILDNSCDSGSSWLVL